MNYMSEVAKILGVELGERFKLNLYDEYDKKYYGDNEYYLCDEGVKLDKKDHLCVSADLLLWILSGKISIKRKPWKPTYDENYYYVDEDGHVCKDMWLGCCDDILLYKCGNCYKTHADASQYANEWYAFFKSDKMLEV